MNSKMTTNSQLSTTEPKNRNKDKLSRQLEQEQITEMEIPWRVISREKENGGKVQGIRSTNGRTK